MKNETNVNIRACMVVHQGPNTATSLPTLISWRATHPHDVFHASGAYSYHAVVCETSTAQRRQGVWPVFGGTAVQSTTTIVLCGQTNLPHMYL